MARKTHNGDVAELFELLDRAAGPVMNSMLCRELQWSDERLHAAKKQLLRERSIYATQEGIILQKYASTEQQIWHLGWSLGLFETAGIHLTMDKELLLEAPRVIKQLIDEGKFDKAEKLMEFRHRVHETMELPRQLLQVYNQVNVIVDQEIKLIEAKEALRKKYRH